MGNAPLGAKVLDEILDRGGDYRLDEIRIGQRPTDPTYARIDVRAGTAAALIDILAAISEHGATPVNQQSCTMACELAHCDETLNDEQERTNDMRWRLSGFVAFGAIVGRPH